MSEPRTEAGKALVKSGPRWPSDQSVIVESVLVIEEQAAAETRRELLAKVEGLRVRTDTGYTLNAQERAWNRCVDAVIALLDPSR